MKRMAALLSASPGVCHPDASSLVIYVVMSPGDAYLDWWASYQSCCTSVAHAYAWGTCCRAYFIDVAYFCKVRKLVIETYDQRGKTPGDVRCVIMT